MTSIPTIFYGNSFLLIHFSTRNVIKINVPNLLIFIIILQSYLFWEEVISSGIGDVFHNFDIFD